MVGIMKGKKMPRRSNFVENWSDVNLSAAFVTITVDHVLRPTSFEGLGIIDRYGHATYRKAYEGLVLFRKWQSLVSRDTNHIRY